MLLPTLVAGTVISAVTALCFFGFLWVLFNAEGDSLDA